MRNQHPVIAPCEDPDGGEVTNLVDHAPADPVNPHRFLRLRLRVVIPGLRHWSLFQKR